MSLVVLVGDKMVLITESLHGFDEACPDLIHLIGHQCRRGFFVKPLPQRGEGQDGLGLTILAWSVVADHGHGRLDPASCQPPVCIARGGRLHGFQQLSQEVGAE